jgi:predicted nucleic acid-binding protein
MEDNPMCRVEGLPSHAPDAQRRCRTLVTGDQDLLVLADSFAHSHGLRIVTPAAYLLA